MTGPLWLPSRRGPRPTQTDAAGTTLTAATQTRRRNPPFPSPRCRRRRSTTYCRLRRSDTSLASHARRPATAPATTRAPSRRRTPATRDRSSAPMNTTPPAVTIGPPRFGVPSGVVRHARELRRRIVAGSPSGTSHARAPVLRSIATSEPHGGLRARQSRPGCASPCAAASRTACRACACTDRRGATEFRRRFGRVELVERNELHQRRDRGSPARWRSAVRGSNATPPQCAPPMFDGSCDAFPRRLGGVNTPSLRSGRTEARHASRSSASRPTRRRASGAAG